MGKHKEYNDLDLISMLLRGDNHKEIGNKLGLSEQYVHQLACGMSRGKEIYAVVQQYKEDMIEATRRAIAYYGPKAVKKLNELLSDEDHKTQRQAASDLLRFNPINNEQKKIDITSKGESIKFVSGIEDTDL